MNEEVIGVHAIWEIPDFWQANRYSLLMGTASLEGVPDISSVKYVMNENEYYIYIRESDRCTRNLMDTGRASLMLIDDNQSLTDISFKESHKFDCKAQLVFPTSNHFDVIMNQFSNRFGRFIHAVSDANEYSLFRISKLGGYEPDRGC